MLLALLSFAFSHANAAWKEYNLGVPSERKGVQQPFVLSTGENVPVTHAVLWFTGGDGAILPAREGVHTLESAGMSWRGYFAEKLGAIAQPAVPQGAKGMEEGMGLSFRETDEHAADIKPVVDTLKKLAPKAKIVVAGISNGAISAFNVAASLKKAGFKDLSGVVILSASAHAFRKDWVEELKDVPVLVVHHKRDTCLTFRDVEPVAKWHTFVPVEDGNKPRTAARDCGPSSAHVFHGRFEPVIEAIREWIVTGKTVTEIK
jgi:alpha/beta superfamily hydrolase